MKTLLMLFGPLVALRAFVSAADVETSRNLTLDGARRVMAAAEACADAAGASGAIAIVDNGGHLLLLVRRPGTFLGSPEISVGKARTAAEFKKPTRDFEETIARGRYAMTTLPGFTPLQGGVPIMHEGHFIGAIGVSGAMSASQDEEIALAGAAALQRRDS